MPWSQNEYTTTTTHTEILDRKLNPEKEQPYTITLAKHLIRHPQRIKIDSVIYQREVPEN